MESFPFYAKNSFCGDFVVKGKARADSLARLGDCKNTNEHEIIL